MNPPLNKFEIFQYANTSIKKIALSGGYDVIEKLDYTSVITGLPCVNFNYIFVKNPLNLPKKLIQEAGVPLLFIPENADAEENLEANWNDFSTLQRFDNVMTQYNDQLDAFSANNLHNFDIRPLQSPSDLESLDEITTICHGTPLKMTTTFLRYAIFKDVPDLHLFLAWVDGKPVGTGGIAIVDNVANFLWDSVLPEYRNRGIASALTKYRLSFAHKLGIKTAIVQNMPPSVGYYQRAGFKPVGSISLFMYTPPAK